MCALIRKEGGAGVQKILFMNKFNTILINAKIELFVVIISIANSQLFSQEPVNPALVVSASAAGRWFAFD